MKKLLTGLLLTPIALYGQTINTQPSNQTLNGSVAMPGLMSISIMSVTEQTFRMSDFEEIDMGKLYKNFLTLNVKSNRPWIVSVMSDNKYFTPSSPMGSLNLPVSILYLKRPDYNYYIPLSHTPQQLVQSSNNLIENNYNIDLQVTPCYNYRGGQYHTNLILTISPL